MGDNNCYIYGTLGYTLLKNNENKSVLIFSDMHDKLEQCKHNISIDNLLKNKMKSSNILLEEVPREGVKLIDLWESSPHTKSLKELFLNNSKIINGIDIRPYYIPYSWELVQDEIRNDTLLTYMEKVINFFTLGEHSLASKIDNYNSIIMNDTCLRKHFKIILKKYIDIVDKYYNIFNHNVNDIAKNNASIVNDINNILDNIIEWNIVFNIHKSTDKTIIVHAGMLHTERVIEWLINYYGYKIISEKGINKIINSFGKIYGCVELDKNILAQFGGKIKI